MAFDNNGYPINQHCATMRQEGLDSIIMWKQQRTLNATSLTKFRCILGRTAWGRYCSLVGGLLNSSPIIEATTDIERDECTLQVPLSAEQNVTITTDTQFNTFAS